jgi:hypothetical protein
LGIEVDGSADIKITLDLHIEIFLDKKTSTVNAAVRSWWAHAHVPWPTSWGVSASEVLAKLKTSIAPQINKVNQISKVPKGINILSLKVMPNGDLNGYMEPLA